MAVALEASGHSFHGLLLRYWTAFARTVIGDIIATAIAITGISALFLACSFAVIWLARMGAAIWHLVG